MRKLWRMKSRGAVTVFVTLLLIPSVLITGTGVDIARVYAARSMLQDANQLAINSLMADYDAQLQDLYGLFAVTEGDEELKKLVNEYVEKVIFASDAGDTGGMGTLQAFYGSEVESAVAAGEGQNLGERDKLRRQIEEYAKLRAPVIVAEEIFERLDDFDQVNDDSRVIKKKISIEKKIENIDKYYKKIYENIQALNGYQSTEGDAINNANVVIGWVGELLQEMLVVRKEYEAYGNNESQKELQKDKGKEFDALKDNMKSRIRGGYYGADWDSEKSEWKTKVYTLSLSHYANEGAKLLEPYLSVNQPMFGDHTNQTLEDLKYWCTKADEEKEALKQEIEQLREDLKTSGCHQELKDGLQGKDGEEGLLDEYEKLVKFNLTSLAQKMYDRDYAHVNTLVQRMKHISSEKIYFSTENMEENDDFTYYTPETMLSTVQGFDKDIVAINKDRRAKNQNELPDHLYYLGDDGLSAPIRFEPPADDKYYTWLQCADAFGDQGYRDFWNELESIYGGGGGLTKEEKESRQEENEGDILDLLDVVQDLIGEAIPDPEGALYYSEQKSEGGGSGFGKGDDWSEKGKAQDNLSNSLDTDIIEKLGKIADQIANKALLLVYSSDMFSNYTTEEGEENMAGTALGIKNNYFFQSELEYIYHGNENDAMSNHNAVGGMIILVRFVMNYVAAFSVRFVNDVVNEIRTALAWLGPAGIAIAELARMALALAESVVDLSLLRSGHKVALLKNDDTWKLDPGTIGELSKSVIESAGDDDKGDDALDDDFGFIYMDYLRLFLLFVDGDTMAKRVGRLIEFNMTYVTQGIGSKGSREERESAMSAATLYDLSKARTGFSVTTTAQIDMLFMSMPLAQKGMNGVVPPTTFAVSATDYRGY